MRMGDVWGKSSDTEALERGELREQNLHRFHAQETATRVVTTLGQRPCAGLIAS